jgi:prepilin-type N-terminal cleavage/methylation domain-containing protein
MRMRKQGFTLVELLVVIAIIAMLLAILMPALAKVKTLAYQMLCGTNLKGIANAILVYTQDNNEKYPVGGPASGTWNAGATATNPAGKISWVWDEIDKQKILSTSKGSVSSCLFLLVKYADVSPASFVCKASKQTKMNMGTLQATGSDELGMGANPPGVAGQAKDATECWDFGKFPSRHCSYAYAYPWASKFVPTSASKSGLAVAADANPWIDKGDAPAWNAGVTSGTDSPQLITASDKSTFSYGNTKDQHEQAGQNVLFNDMHVEFSKQPNPDSAIQNDNIYTPWNTTQANGTEAFKRQKGMQPKTIAEEPKNKEDSYLVQW